MSPKPVQSNFRRLKKRLQLKDRVDVSEEPVGSELEDDIEVEAPAPPQATHKDQLGQGASKYENKNKSNLFNRSSPMKIVRVCKGMTKDQRQVIIDADFGDALKMKCSKLNPELCRFLMGCFNPDTCELDFGERGRIPITLESVVKVMGVPMGSIPVSYKLDPEATRVMLDMFGIEDGKQPTIASLEKELGPTHPANHFFLRKFIIYLVCSVFAPTTGIAVSPRCYPSLVNTADIPRLNWPRFIINTMIQTVRAKDKKNLFKACMPYLMVLYVDSLETSAVSVPKDGTRICLWTNKMVNIVVELDTNNDGSFGKLPLKQCFRNKLSLFSAEPSVLNTFIKMHLPGDHTDDDLVKYRAALTEMCNVFEDGLAQFLKNISTVDAAKTHEEHQPEFEQLSSRRMRARIKRSRQTTLRQTMQSVKEVEEANVIMDMNATTTEAQSLRNSSMKRWPDEEEAHTDRSSRKKQKQESEHCTETVNPTVTEVEKDQAALQNVKEGSIEQITEKDQAAVHGEKEANLEQNMEKDQAGVQNAGDVSLEHDMVIAPLLPMEIDSLKQLQLYGTGSQSTSDSTGNDVALSKISPTDSINIFMEHSGDVINSESKLKSARKTSSAKSNKSVSFSDKLIDSLVQDGKTMSEVCVEANCSPTNLKGVAQEIIRSSPARRPVTRSMSPVKPASPITKDSPRRLTRFATAQARANRLVESTSEGPSTSKLSMTRNLEKDFGRTKVQSETEKQRIRQQLIDSYPSFDLGFGTQENEGESTENVPAVHAEEHVIISSNEDSGDSLDKIYSAIEMPATTPVSVKARQVQSTGSPSAPDSITPVPQPHQKRVVKAVRAQKSPFVQYENKLVASKPTCDLYNKLCSYGGKSQHPANKENIIETGDWFLNLRDFANSLKPTGWLSNSTCEFALHALSTELVSQKKYVMSLGVATKLRNPNWINDRVVQKAFEFSASNRLDHKELIMFSVLQNISTSIKVFTGHYYLIVLNLKAERFEVMDSMRSEGNPSLMSDSGAIIGSIKYLWAKKYQESRIDISKYRSLFVDTPMQKTTCDCGYFMLRLIETWDGRRFVPQFSQKDIPTIRKLSAKKWIDREDNKVIWQELLFQN